jgi:hypothetical protein
MLEHLKAYCIRAHEAARACDNYTCSAGFQLGHTDAERHLRNNERDKHREVMRFSEGVGFTAVVVFAIGVTLRLLAAMLRASVLRAGVAALQKRQG